ncbi:MAG: domain S-box-containing protein [Firmicutes bacterium]|nr:domain S-box-containing protein [Bacillota bacterium]
MRGGYGPMVISFGLLLVVTLVIDNFLTALVRSEEFKIVGYIILLLVLATLIMYSVYLKHALLVAGKKIAIYDYAWRQISCGFAVTGRTGETEVYGEKELFELFGFSGAKTNYNVLADEGKCAYPVTQTEVCVLPDGERRYADRLIIPVIGINGGYVVEFLFDVSERLLEIAQREEDYLRIIKILVNMFEMKDPYCHGHSEVVSDLAQDLAREAGVAETEVKLIATAALLRDIGKTMTSGNLLDMGNLLTDEHYNNIKDHSGMGADILSSIENFRDIAILVRHHHERFDGQGYPAGMRGTEIPLGSRIIAVVDAFEAMTAGRSGIDKMDVKATLAVLRAEKGRKFDPSLVDAFINIVSVGRVKNES